MTHSSTPLHPWFDFVEKSGLVLGEPVLHVRFPNGPEKVSPRSQRALLAAWQRLEVDPTDPTRRSRWFDSLFSEFLGIPREKLLRGNDLPGWATVPLDDVADSLVPSALLADGSAGTPLAIWLLPSDQDFDRLERLPGRWRATPQAKLERWLRGAGQPLGLLTNGASLRLVHVPPGLPAGWLEFDAPALLDEKALLDGFFTLLSADRFFGPEPLRLARLIAESQDRQAELTDTLGLQVRDAVEKLLLAFDRADEESKGTLLAGLDDDECYRLAVAVVMRLVFLLFAEERNLLPHGNLFYDDAYGLGRLLHRLEEERRERPERFAAERDAWPRLLALFRLVFQGSAHPDLPLPAYGGDLFDPRAFRAMKRLERPELALANDAVAGILRALTSGTARVGRETILQRYSYRTLDVEHIGYLYEGLLDHRAARAGAEPLIKLRNGSEEAWPLTELEGRSAEALVAFLVEHKVLGGNEDRIRARLAEPPADEQASLDVLPAPLAERCRPFAGVIQTNEVVRPGRLFLTTSASRRATGTHYTPIQYTRAMVEETLEPLVFAGEAGLLEEPRRLRSPRELLALRICDPAMGSGAFLVQVVRYLSGKLVDSWWAERERRDAARRSTDSSSENPSPAQAGEGGRAKARPGEGILLHLPYAEPAPPREDRIPIPSERDEAETWARRIVAERCVYGVDKNPLAVEMAKLSLWLVTLSRDKPFSFVDHALKSGDSLLGLSTLDQLRTWSLDGKGTVNFVPSDAVNEALTLRRQIQELPVATPEDVAEKARLHAAAEAKTAALKAFGDLFMATILAESNSKRRSERLSEALTDAVTRLVDPNAIAARAREDLAGHHPFHWPLEFPEVFERAGSGFDAMVGNPPYMGGQKLTGALGTPYREYLVTVLAREARGSADLVAYFFLRAYGLLREGGTFGLLAINTIAEGDTRQVGLEQLLTAGATIYSSHPNEPWPGSAAVVTTRVHVVKGSWKGSHALLGKKVPRISAYLTSREEWTPKQLKANEGIAFQGSIVLGLGFTMSEEEALAIIAKDKRYQDVLFPYLNGKDLNSHPEQKPSRWVINFWDWPEERAREYPEVFRIVEEKVKPERMLVNRKARRDRWWQHAELASGLYHAIGRGRLFEKHPEGWEEKTRRLDSILVTSRHTKFWAPTLVASSSVPSEATVVFATGDLLVLALLQSSIHSEWAWKQASLLETRLRYTPSDCFETFPWPEATLDQLSQKAGTFLETRTRFGLCRNLGLTDLYNRLHDASDHDPDLQRLRDLQVEIDRVVAEAYGWSDLDLGHDFHNVPYLPENDRTRFTVSEEARHQILDRLAQLNRERYDEEVKQGLHSDKRAPRSSTPAAPPSPTRLEKRSRPKPPEPQQPTLFDLDPEPEQEPQRKVAEPTTPYHPASPPTRLLTWLASNPGWHGKAEILEGSAVEREDWKKAIDGLLEAGKVDREGERRGARYRAHRLGDAG
jgi:hypothetical protein